MLFKIFLQYLNEFVDEYKQSRIGYLLYSSSERKTDKLRCISFYSGNAASVCFINSGNKHVCNFYLISFITKFNKFSNIFV